MEKIPIELAIPTREYAGIWRRIAAQTIDLLIIYAVALLTGKSLFSIAIDVLLYFPKWFQWLSLDPDRYLSENALLLWTGTGIIMATIYYVIYSASFQSSKFMATPGKWILRIKVTDLNGKRISFARALIREIAKLISCLFCFFGFIVAAHSRKKQSLYDMISACLVVKGRE